MRHLPGLFMEVDCGVDRDSRCPPERAVELSDVTCSACMRRLQTRPQLFARLVDHYRATRSTGKLTVYELSALVELRSSEDYEKATARYEDAEDSIEAARQDLDSAERDLAGASDKLAELRASNEARSKVELVSFRHKPKLRLVKN